MDSNLHDTYKSMQYSWKKFVSHLHKNGELASDDDLKVFIMDKSNFNATLFSNTIVETANTMAANFLKHARVNNQK